jgi:S-DNA-T family DNA segregation ATPase FtsK/SpoIIIE
VSALGLAAYPFLAAWFVAVLLLVLRRAWLTWLLRLAGWLLLVPCTAVLADRWGGAWAGAPLEGPGGAAGAWLSLALASRLHPAGGALVLGAVTLLAVVLALDVVLVPLLRLVRRTARVLRGGARSANPQSAIRNPQSSTEGEPESAEGPAGVHAIPIRHHDEAARVNLVLPDAGRFTDYKLPPLTLLEDPRPFACDEHDAHLRERAALLEKTFADFGLRVRVVGINTGPVITQFEVALETGLRVHKVTRLADDVALNLKVPSVRMVAPIPGKNTVGIEIPNELRADVRLKEVILASARKVAKLKLPLFLGKDAEGRPLVHDLAGMPHLLIAGSTGTGKSVCLNTLILSLLMTRRPDEVRMIMIDPKNGVELQEYSRLPHLMHPIVTDMKKSEAILAWAVDKMEERYDLLRRARVRNIAGYNELGPKEVLRRLAPADEEERRRVPSPMPYVVIIIDEFADLIMMLRKEIEGHVIRLAQKSRAAGIHLVLATQKPTVDVITGLIKSNMPARICFRVSNRSDSRVVLDEMGADKLLGKGDLLFLPPGTSTLIRGQGTYASDEEIRRVAEHLDCDPVYAPELVQLNAGGGAEGGLAERLRARDELYEAAIEVVVREGRGSVSLLQRALGIGYGRAARLIDFMAEDGIVGAYNGSSAREVLYTPEQWRSLKETRTGESA